MEQRSRGVVPFVRLLSSRLLALALGALAAAAPVFSTEIFPVKDLAPGMKGFTLSDLGDGKGVQRFDIEIVGVLLSYAPKQDLVLARVHSQAIEKTGIIAGMSGSPVYVDGRLVGALAYGWPFSREPICGITPIQSMLDIRKAPAAPPVPIGGTATPASQFLSTFGGRDFANGLTALLTPFRSDGSSPGPVALPLPVSFSGAAAGGGLFGRVAEAAGWLVAPSGASGRPASAPVRPDRRPTPTASSRAPPSRRSCSPATWSSRRPARSPGWTATRSWPSAIRFSRWVRSTCRWPAPRS